MSIEGIDGAGKSTLAGELRELAEDDPGLRPVLTCSEFGSPIGPPLESQLDTFGPYARAYAFGAERYWFFDRCMQLTPRLIIWDRYIDSALACRDADVVLGRAESAVRDAVIAVDSRLPAPHLTVFVDLVPAVALSRVTDREAERGLSLDNDREALTAQAAAFSALISRDPERFLVVDGMSPMPEIARRVIAEIHRRLEA